MVLAKGQPGDVLEKRLQKGLELFQAGCARHIICSGGQGQNEVFEASTMRDWLIARGVDETLISVDNFGQDSYCQYAVLYQASQIPEDNLKQILDPPQIATIQRILALARGYAQFLKANGFEWDRAWPEGAGADANARAKVEPQAPLEEIVP